ncbi:hypothetical protein [Methylobacterium komagatae]
MAEIETQNTSGDWAYEVAKDIREKWMRSAFMNETDFALPSGHLSDMAEALRHADAVGYTRGHEAGEKHSAAPAAKGGTEVPAGWKLVPEEPTTEMLVASNLALDAHISSFTKEQRGSRWGKPDGIGYRVKSREKATVRYRAMLKASPPPPAGAAGDERPASKIIAGMQDAVAFAQGDTSRGRIVYPAGAAGSGSGDLGALSAEAREAALAVVRAAWALVDNTGHHDLLPLAVNRDDWDELAARLMALKALLPTEESACRPTSCSRILLAH